MEFIKKINWSDVFLWLVLALLIISIAGISLPFFFLKNHSHCSSVYTSNLLTFICKITKDSSYIPALLSAIGSLGAICFSLYQYLDNKKQIEDQELKTEKTEYKRLRIKINSLMNHWIFVLNILTKEYLVSLELLKETLPTFEKEENPVPQNIVQWRDIHFLLDEKNLSDLLVTTESIRKSDYVSNQLDRIVFSTIQVNSDIKTAREIIYSVNEQCRYLSRPVVKKSLMDSWDKDYCPYSNKMILAVIENINVLFTYSLIPLSAILYSIEKNGFTAYEKRISEYRKNSLSSEDWNVSIEKCFKKEIENEILRVDKFKKQVQTKDLS